MTDSTVCTCTSDRVPDPGEITSPTQLLERDHPAYNLAKLYEDGFLFYTIPEHDCAPWAYAEYSLVVNELVEGGWTKLSADSIRDGLSDDAEDELDGKGGPTQVTLNEGALGRETDHHRGDPYWTETHFKTTSFLQRVFDSIPPGVSYREAAKAIHELALTGDASAINYLFSGSEATEDTGDRSARRAEEHAAEMNTDISSHDHEEDSWLSDANEDHEESDDHEEGRSERPDGAGRSANSNSRSNSRSESNPNSRSGSSTSSSSSSRSGFSSGSSPGSSSSSSSGSSSSSSSSSSPGTGSNSGSRSSTGCGSDTRDIDDVDTGTNGFGQKGGRPPENPRSERSDGENEVDICFVNPPVKEQIQREQWPWLVSRSRSIQEQWMWLYLVNKSKNGGTYNSSIEDDDDWVVISSEQLHEDFHVPYPTEDVWRGSSLIEAWEGGRYISPEEAEERGIDPKARKFRPKREALNEWVRIGAKGESRRYKGHVRKELVRTDEPQPMETKLYDSSRNDIPPVVKQALEVLSEVNPKMILDAVEEAEEAIAEREGAEARDQLTSLRLAKETAKRQVIMQQDGVAQLQNAYEIQEISGRVGFRRGGPQGMMAEVKARAYDIDGYRNFDIASCHTSGFKQVAKMLGEVGVDIDVSAWEEYSGKYEVAAETGLPVSLIKVVEHAIKYGAYLPCSIAQAKEVCVGDDEDPDDRSNWPAIAKEAKDHEEKGLLEDADEALSTLHSVFSEMRKVVIEIADALLNEYYDAQHSGGWMENACGVSFGKHTYDEGHEQRTKVMAWMLQGLEAAFCHHLTILSADCDAFSVVANEHDGLIIRKDVDDEEAFEEALGDAIDKAREESGFYEAEFVEKEFAEEEDVEEVYNTDEPEEDQTSGSTEEVSKEETSNEEVSTEQTSMEQEPPRPPRGNDVSREERRRLEREYYAQQETGVPQGSEPDRPSTASKQGDRPSEPNEGGTETDPVEDITDMATPGPDESESEEPQSMPGLDGRYTEIDFDGT